MKNCCPVAAWRSVIVAIALFLSSHTLAEDSDTEKMQLPSIEETVVLPRGSVQQKYSADDVSRTPEAKPSSDIPTLDHNARNRVFEFVPRRREGQVRPSGNARTRR